MLDFGCGPGFIWDHLVTEHARWRYFALDFSAKSVEAIVAKGGNDSRFIGASLVDGLPTGLRAQSFDAVLLIEVIEHLSDEHLELTIQEIRRLLRPKGVLLVTTPNDENLEASTHMCPECGAVFHEWQHVRSWTAESLCAALEKVGFVVKRTRKTDLRARDPLRMAVRLTRKYIFRHSVDPHLIMTFELAAK